MGPACAYLAPIRVLSGGVETWLKPRPSALKFEKLWRRGKGFEPSGQREPPQPRQKPKLLPYQRRPLRNVKLQLSIFSRS
jgi:hypothetical protein